MKNFTFKLSYNPPLDWQTLLKFFLMHQIIGVERISDNTYERGFRINGIIGFFKITNQIPCLILEVKLTDKSLLPLIKQQVENMFDLNLDVKLLAEKFSQHSLLKNTYVNYPALRIPGGWDKFETSINTIVSQSISIAAARKILAKLVVMYGMQIIHPDAKQIMYLFPEPQTLYKADLMSLGMNNMKITAIKELSAKVISKEIDLETDNHEQLKLDLLKVKGIGHWTTEYIMLRCAQSKNAFPGNDLILKRYTKEHLDLQEFEGIKSYLAIYLWQHYLSSKCKII
ncbi:MAG: DNA-3-methyladenine glycosylase 2 family protein [Rickettsiaceae bacterium]|nr:MAG: DNA-3-methyladenine glycosylase 2 family protein [Rickettsiaceae bacterium]